MKIRAEKMNGRVVRVLGADLHAHGTAVVCTPDGSSLPATAVLVDGDDLFILWECGFSSDPFSERIDEQVFPLMKRELCDEVIEQIHGIVRTVLQAAVERHEVVRDFQGAWHHEDYVPCLGDI